MNILGVVALSAVNRKLVHRVAIASLLRLATATAAVFALLTAVLAWRGTGGIWGIALPMFLVFSMNGIIAACANAAALASVEKTVGGAAAALIGALQYGSGIVSSLLLAAFSDGTQRAMTGLIALFVGLSALMAMGGRRVVV